MEEIQEEIQDSELPITHSFVYKDKRFPFNMGLFQLYSRYFEINKNKIKQNNEIDLIDYDDDINGLSETTINNFVKYCQKEKIRLNEENAFSLYKLSKKYGVDSLIKATDKFMKANHQYFAIQFIQMNQTEGNYFFEEICEEIIANNFKKYIEDDELLKLPINVLHRIASKYFKKEGRKLNEEREIIEFLFRCLDKYERIGSVLFESVEFGEMSNEVYRRLLTDYSNKFDFHFINQNQLKNLYELSNEIIRREEEIKIYQLNNETTTKRQEEEGTKLRQEILKHKQEIDEIKRENDSQIEQLEQTFKNKIDELKREKDSQIEQIRQEMTNKIDEIKREKDSQIEQHKQTFINKIDEIKRENEIKNSQQQEENRKLTEKVIQQANIIEQLSNQIKEPLKSHISCQFISESNPKGIISRLNDSVTLSAGGKHNPSQPLSNIKIYNDNYFYNYNGKDASSESDSYIKFDFGPNNKIDLSSYFIRSNGDPPSKWYHAKSWRVEGSNDESHWTRLDHRVNDGNLNGPHKQHHFECQESRPGDINYRYRYIQWIQEDSWYNKPYNVYITYFELYGEIFKSE